ncbi:hypothetical protein SAMN03159382_04115 [Pseudomonas sp. NFACC23-1]|nr:hypothetical protein SAMN03159386_04117 [Pseudomonas sp. NFACC17-2]SEJ74319.1 hypothetical protein SAMN03159382_04115 [Pseudomonas sp. NFACC23-1]SFW86295.1 hypothetical protein SAMN05660640_04502 [Pseudomonas sp. NFACC16-2]
MRSKRFVKLPTICIKIFDLFRGSIDHDSIDSKAQSRSEAEHMEKHTFIDRYFHSQRELMDIRHTENRNINTLFTYLNNLHSTADKLMELFDCNIKTVPEFKLLRIVRNYFHHVGDVDEIRLCVKVEENVMVSHSQHLLIPLEVFAKSVKSFIDNTVPGEKNRNYKAKLKFVQKEMSDVAEIFDYASTLMKDLEVFCKKPSLRLDGKAYELGFDIYKFVFNISNIIADKCRDIPELCEKKVIQELDSSYRAENNIGKYDVFCSPSNVPITTTEGFVYAKEIKLAHD